LAPGRELADLGIEVFMTAKTVVAVQ